MTKLKKLNLRYNRFKQLPLVVCSLKSLNSLDISFNSELKRLSEQILHLGELQELDCSGNSSLSFPPYAVCKQGTSAVKKYFSDFWGAQGVELTIVPVAVVGQTQSGKTSLVKSLQAGRRILNKRVPSNENFGDPPIESQLGLTEHGFFSSACHSNADAQIGEPQGANEKTFADLQLDGATRVFHVKKLMLPNAEIVFVDYGGHEVYHIAYQLMVKDRCIPMLVVNLQELLTVQTSKNIEAAVRQTCFDWMSHLYLACPGLGPPILVFTHADKVQREICRDQSTH